MRIGEEHSVSDVVDYSRPVAYDVQGQPLYATPQVSPTFFDPLGGGKSTQSYVTRARETYDGENFNPKLRAQYANAPHIVHASRQYSPDAFVISKELRERHEQSQKEYPNLNLSEAEYVLHSVKRHPIGLVFPMITSVSIVVLLFAGIVGYPIISDLYEMHILTKQTVGIVLLLLIALVGIGGYLAVWVYLRNTFYLTNETVIQEIQYSLFSYHEQTVSLGSVEDVSYIQHGILPTLLNYGEIRLSTEGEETTYRFKYVSNPKQQVARISNAVEAFKNGRPVAD